MKRLLMIALVGSVVLTSCKTEKKDVKTSEKEVKVEYMSFGEAITNEEAISADEMRVKYENLKAGDTLNIKYASTINEVCKKKGCWMKLDLGEEKESMVRFKDYGFFMPLNADSKEVVVNGKAFVTEISVDELQHYAKDAGKSEEEIAQITEPKYTYAFEADGVLMKK
ncbi:DUF4920 domain-containing protein [Tenacibaculum caenipelagi]|nr:DUF4920 domain-containing protein [Tenacibaculum caenipelagi]